MKYSIKQAVSKSFKRVFETLSADFVEREEAILVNQGRILTHMLSDQASDNILDYEFQIFSQWGEDGILQFLIRKTNPEFHTFIEFGTQTFSESNCRFLMIKDGWRGMIIDGSEKNIDIARRRRYAWRHALIAESAFITKDNIHALISGSGFQNSLGILSIDIDGVDYFVAEALGDWTPAILIVEYNALFGPKAAVSVPYDPGFVRHEKHHSNLYYGASLAAFRHLFGPRGYALVGTNSAGNNAFFVRRDLLWSETADRAAEDVFRQNQFRESRDINGALSYLEPDEARQMLASMPLVDVVTGRSLTVGQIEL